MSDEQAEKAWQARAHELEKTVEALTTERKEALSDLAEAKDAALRASQAGQDKLAELAATVADQAQELEKVKAERDAAQAQAAKEEEGATQRCRQLEEENGRTQGLVAELQAKLAAAEDRADKAEAALASLRNTRKAECIEMREGYERGQRHLLAELEELRSTSTQISLDLAEKMKQVAEQAARAAAAEREWKTVSAKAEETEKRSKEMQERITGIEAREKEFHIASGKHAAELAAAKREATLAKEQTTRVQNQLAEQRDKYEARLAAATGAQTPAALASAVAGKGAKGAKGIKGAKGAVPAAGTVGLPASMHTQQPQQKQQVQQQMLAQVQQKPPQPTGHPYPAGTPCKYLTNEMGWREGVILSYNDKVYSLRDKKEGWELEKWPPEHVKVEAAAAPAPAPAPAPAAVPAPKPTGLTANNPAGKLSAGDRAEALFQGQWHECVVKVAYPSAYDVMWADGSTTQRMPLAQVRAKTGAANAPGPAGARSAGAWAGGTVAMPQARMNPYGQMGRGRGFGY